MDVQIEYQINFAIQSWQDNQRAEMVMRLFEGNPKVRSYATNNLTVQDEKLRFDIEKLLVILDLSSTTTRH